MTRLRSCDSWARVLAFSWSARGLALRKRVLFSSSKVDFKVGVSVDMTSFY